MVLAREKPALFDAFWFEGGGDREARAFQVWAHERGFHAAWVQGIEYQSEYRGGETNVINETMWVIDNRYVKGEQLDMLEMPPKRWFIIGLDGRPFLMSKEAFERRFEKVVGA
jgi:hypothetical protein